MARKELFHEVTGTKGRDEGKVFFIQEMPASKAEAWAIRCALAMAKGGVELPENFADLGMAGLAKVGLGLLAKVPFEEAKPLLDEIMTCVQFVPDPQNHAVKRHLIESDIEEVGTRLKLRAEVFNLHVDFITAA
ncbi:hypothetical protein F0336_14055 [Serratia liquefaciens]|jgi:hypothetical protein|uniref:hypothetical protein n=1 Tax=Serratia liquefaciens TaxID=614 RepID=UPI0011F0E33B|nr:hypothetical protein [Serratia liquefaciens]QIC87507.1 hypothetical protein F0336_14055 [Serratia liquefaciens]